MQKLTYFNLQLVLLLFRFSFYESLQIINPSCEPTNSIKLITPSKGIYLPYERVNFFKAWNICREMCMDLLTITSYDEEQAIENYIKDTSYETKEFWISANDLATEGSFYWLATGKMLEYTNWSPGEPNNDRNIDPNGEHCVYRSGYNKRWNDDRCILKLYFICEVRL